MTTLHTLEWFLQELPETNRSGCLQFLADHKDRIETAPGSFIKHQAWEGGYRNHLEEALRIAKELYESLSTIRTLPFSLVDAYTGIFWHDAEKIFKYTEPKKKFEDDKQKLTFIITTMRQYNIEISEELRNALMYVHGEGEMYNSFENVQKPLAAFIHCCDTISARIWPDFPQKSNQ